MRRVIALLLWVTISAHAVEVTTIGYGSNVESATKNAKTLAVEQVTGAFLRSQSSEVDGKFRSVIDQYSGGVITSYQVLSINNKYDLTEVRIKAVVDPDKVNLLISSAGEVPSKMAGQLTTAQEKLAQIQEMVTALDHPKDAYVVSGKIVKYLNRGDYTDAIILVSMRWSPKWYDDVKKFSALAGKNIDLDNSTSNALWVIGTLLTPFSLNASSAVTTMARHTEKAPVVNPIYAYCFSKSRDDDAEACREVGYGMQNITAQDSWTVIMRLIQNDSVVTTLPLVVHNKDQLFGRFRIGSNVYFRNTAYARKFTNPGVLLFEEGVAWSEITQTVKTDLLKSIDRIEFELCTVDSADQWCGLTKSTIKNYSFK